jgi:hypothetical protein
MMKLEITERSASQVPVVTVLSNTPCRARTIRWIEFSLCALWWIEFSLRALWWIMPPGMFQGHALPRIWRQ